MTLFLQILLIFFSPYLGIRLLQYFPQIKWLSPVVWSYALGIIVANTHMFPIHTFIATNISHVAILFAIPLLLYSTNLIAWFRHARSTVWSFGLCILTGLVSSTLMSFVFEGIIDDSWRLAAMLVGVYTGGTPNLNAIGLALEAKESSLVLLNAADTVCGVVYILFLTSFAPTLLSKFLPEFQTLQHDTTNPFNETVIEKKSSSTLNISSILQALGLTLCIIAVSVGIAYMISGTVENIVLIILSLTTLSVLASLSPSIRQIKGSFEIGEYLLLVFCVAIGMLADFSKLVEEGGMILVFTACVMFSAILLHYFLAALLRIDRDTVMITSTAAIMGPVFVGQIASVIQNKQLVFSGMATGLMGYAIGNYLGIGLGYVLKTILQ